MQVIFKNLFFISLPLATLGSITSISPTTAQVNPITPDNTLGGENSVVIPVPSNNLDLITGGAKRGANLFHSFLRFGILNGKSAYFFNPSDVTNIITRVTGREMSKFFGTLGTLDINGNIGNANIFLINPRGIVFGVGSSLNIGGSFFASTGDSIVFDNGFEFSASNPQAPPLLNVNIPTGLRFRDNPGNIDVVLSDLRVRSGQSLTLLGGNVNLNTVLLTAPGGQVQLGGLAEPGIVELNSNDSLSLPNGVRRGDVSLIIAGISTSAPNSSSGRMAIYARNLFASSSAIDNRNFTGEGGEILFDATEVASFQNTAVVAFNSGSGKGGDVTINARQLSIEGGGISTTTTGEGRGGNITIDAPEGSVTLSGTPASFSASLFTGTTGSGNSGNVTITTQQLKVEDGASIATNTEGTGLGGNLIVNASGGSVELNGSGSSLRAETRGSNKGGNLQITTGRLILQNGALVSTSTFGQGNAGDLTVRASDSVELSGETSGQGGNPGFPGGLFAQVDLAGVGQGGNLTIETGRLSISDGSKVQVATFGRGDAGNLNIRASKIEVFNTPRFSDFTTGIFATADTDPRSVNRPEGEGGSIRIETGQLSIRDGGKISVSTAGGGNAGTLVINASDFVEVVGVDPEPEDGPSFLGAGVTEGATGRGGEVTIATRQLSIRNGGQVSTSTAGDGDAGRIVVMADNLEVTGGGQLTSSTSSSRNAGNIILTLRDSLTLTGSGSGIFANTAPGSEGNGGSIFIDPRNIIVRDGAKIAVNSQGTGEGGNIEIQGGSLTLDNNASITAETASSQGGNITLAIDDLLLLRRQSNISATAGIGQNAGDGGNININTTFLVAIPSENSDITANAFTGRGGRVDLTAQGIFGIEPRPSDTPFSDITASSEFGIAGDVTLNTPDTDPSGGLVELPANVVDPQDQISRTPCKQGAGSEFTISGRGGLPANPNETLDSETVRVGLVEPIPSSQLPASGERKSGVGESTVSQPIVPARGWVIGDKGEVVLTAYDPTGNGSQRPESTVNGSQGSLPHACTGL
ncbi:MAG: S-layer family protein [Cyanosarcina radialis HA8281-LM2]|jgi:filamentous hemagglutinin family protein|nr:S-layer family protein [Cyanosarcina radialis HA8281-LM2]